MYSLIKTLLFIMPAETAHHFATKALKFAFMIPFVKSIFQSIYQFEHPKLQRTLFGLTFKNPVGLAAGFDKNGEFIHEFAAMGFGFIEIGTVTPRPQPGNPKPRLFRLKEDEALINRMGFNNLGMDEVKKNLRKKPEGIIIGGNIGKNKVTPNEQATADYLETFEGLYELVDYFVINVSSPNTPDLRKLQDKEPLQALISALQAANAKKPTQKPILLKIAPDLTDTQLDDILEIATTTRLDGIIATNTTIERNELKTPGKRLEKIGNGGLSGAPLLKRSTETIQYLRNQNRDIPIIAVGGIMNEAGAAEKLKAGANLVQIYSGLVYRGPALIKEINKTILNTA